MRFLFVQRVNGSNTGVHGVGFRREGQEFKDYVFRNGAFEEATIQFWDNEEDFIRSNDRSSIHVLDVELPSEAEAMKYMGSHGFDLMKIYQQQHPWTDEDQREMEETQRKLKQEMGDKDEA